MKFTWQNLQKPFFALAPMDGATDTVFRQIVASCGRPDVFFTEFTNVEGIASRGNKEVEKRFKYEKKEKPVIAQIWGLTPEKFYLSAKRVQELGFDGVDINMGCPIRAVIARGACSGLIANEKLAKEIIDATRQGAPDLPLSVKTRIGLKTIETDRWIPFLLQQNLDALTVHLRTAKEMSKVPPHWEEMKKVVEHRNKISPKTMIMGNGDIESTMQAKEKISEYGFEGAMLGRAIFANPWVFKGIDPLTVSKEDKFKLLKKHLLLYEKVWGTNKSYAPLKRFFKIYVNGFPNASEIRETLMATQNYAEGKKVVKEILKNI